AGEVPQPTNVGFFGYIVSGDFDKDNKVDIVVANPDGAEITIWYGNGNGGFRGRQLLPNNTPRTLRNPHGIALEDFDNNGNKDLPVTFENQEKVVVFLGGCDAAINMPPTISPNSPLTRVQATPGDVSTIAMVNDAETPRGDLTVTATSLPDGPSINNIVN